MKLIKNITLFLLLAVPFWLVACGGTQKKSDDSQKVQVKEAVSSGKPVVIDFYATWCGPCKQIAPMFEMLKGEYSDKVEFRSVDVDEDMETTRKYGIEAMPTFVILDADGNEINRIVGADAEALTQAVDALVKK